MTPEQKAAYQQLRSDPERAAFLLDIGVTARPTIQDLELVAQAAVGDVWLPITASTDEEAIAMAVAWLKEKAVNLEGAASAELDASPIRTPCRPIGVHEEESE